MRSVKRSRENAGDTGTDTVAETAADSGAARPALNEKTREPKLAGLSVC